MTEYEQVTSKLILEQFLECNTACIDLTNFKFDRPNDEMGKIDFYMRVLPGAEYIVSQEVNYIFSNGLTTGLVAGDAVLDDFLYGTMNHKGQTNYEVLRDAIGTAASYGKCGLRWYDGSLYVVDRPYYAPLYIKEDGIKKVVGYAVTEDMEKVSELNIDLTKINFETEDITDAIETYFSSKKLILLDKNDFVEIRTDAEGNSPLLKDELRLELLVTVYERLIHDLNYDGPGRILLWAKDGYVGDEDNDISTSSVMNQSQSAQVGREKKAQLELKKITKDIKNSGSDSAILLSNVFSKDIVKLPRVTKSTEFFDWIKKEGVILAQVFGMSPSLLELGDVSGNVSMEKIIDNSMLNSIVPLREKYAIQFSSFLANKLGVSKVYFNKYELQQAEDENTMRTKVVNIMSILNSIRDEEGNTRPECAKLVDNFADMLSANIHNDDNSLKELNISIKKGERKDVNERNA